MDRRSGVLFGLLLSLLVVAGPAAAASPSAAGGSFPARIELPDGFAPEGITRGRGTTFYVGSLVDGAIWRGSFRTGRGSVLVPGRTGQVAVGLEFERRRDRLWVAGGATGTVRVFAARTGALLRTFRFEAGFLNDLVVTRAAVYVTDSLRQQLAVIPLGRHGRLPDESDVRTIALGGEMRYQEGFNVNGIEAFRGWLILVQSNTGRLFRVNPRTGQAHAIDLGGYSISFGGGLERRGSTLYALRNRLNLVTVLRIGQRLRSARLLGELSSRQLDVPTTAAVAAGHLWVVNARFGTQVTPATDYWVTRLPARP